MKHMKLLLCATGVLAAAAIAVVVAAPGAPAAQPPQGTAAAPAAQPPQGSAAAAAVQQPPPGGPADAGAASSAPVPRREASIPQGFRAVTINGRRALCEPGDEAWVTTALGKMPAAARPATAPANMLQRIGEQREPLIRQFMADFGVTDPVPVARAYDSELTPAIRQLDELRAPIFYLVTAPDRLTALMRSGWSDPHFYYNRAADAVSFNPAGLLTVDRPMDDIIYPVPDDTKAPPEKRAEGLTAVVTAVEAQIAAAIEFQARARVGGHFANMINTLVMQPLALKDDQQWLAVGATSVFAAKYTATITGDQRQQLVGGLLFEHPQAALKMTAVDVLHPADLKTIRQDLIGVYVDTFRRKSARAIQYLIEQAGGDAAVTKAVAAVRDRKPADGTALVKVIQEVSTIDLTPALVR